MHATSFTVESSPFWTHAHRPKDWFEPWSFYELRLMILINRRRGIDEAGKYRQPGESCRQFCRRAEKLLGIT